jgi:hypothetical protein
VVDVRLADDRRARVPFALVGVVLLVGSATFVAALGARAPATTRPAADAVDERLDGAVDAAVDRGFRRAAARAAREPVVTPANTTAGRALEDPFRDALRLRTYRTVRAALRDVAVTAGPVRGTATLPAPADESNLTRTLERVHVSRGPRAGTVTVRIEGVTRRLSRDGRTVGTENRTVERTVASPVLAVHEAATSYDDRLDRGVTDGPGLGRSLAARLYPVAWTRGSLQWAGAPVENVVGTRHVAVATNHALLAEQRAAFGRADPAARGQTATAAVQAGLFDLARGVDSTAASRTRRLLSGPVSDPHGRSLPDLLARPPGGPTPDSTVRVGLNATADRALLGVLDGDLEAAVADAYDVGARLAVARETVRDDERPAPREPEGNWSLVGEHTARDVTVRNASGPTPALGQGWHRFREHTRAVVVRRSTTWTWRGPGGERRTTTADWRTVTRVGVAIDGRHRGGEFAPTGGVATAHDPGGPLDGPNLAGGRSAAVARLTEGASPATLARRAAAGDLDPRTVTVETPRPDGLRTWVVADLAALRERLRNVSAAVAAGPAATGETSPHERLRTILRERRASLLGTPATYPSAAAKARVAARAAYLRAVDHRLAAEADRSDRWHGALDGLLREAGTSLSAARTAMAAERSPPPRGRLFAGEDAVGANVTVAGAPPYLTTGGVTAERVPAVPPGERGHPLRTRNVNLFTLPYDDAAQGLLAAADVPEGAGLRQAGLALRGARRARDAGTDPGGRERSLRAETSSSVAVVRSRVVANLADRTTVPTAERRAAVAALLAPHDTTADRALALANGSARRRMVAELAEREGVAPDGPRGVALSVAVRAAFANALRADDARVPRSLVRSTVTRTRALARGEVGSMVGDELDRQWGRLEERLDAERRVPAGLPLLPGIGGWYATANVWVVDVRGEYAAFTVRTDAGGPGDGLAYRRDGDPVRVNVDGDCERELLGHATQVSLDVTVPVVVVVPPGRAGVGDTDGDAVETSPGWGTAEGGEDNRTVPRRRRAAEVNIGALAAAARRRVTGT